MSRYERMTLGSVVLLCLAWSGFVMGMTEGGLLVDPGPGGVGRLLLVLLLALIVTHAGLWVLTWVRQGSGPDEREAAIGRMADRVGYWLTDAGIFGLILLALAEASVPGRLGSFGVTTPQGLIFALVSLNFAVGLGRLLAAFVLSRRVGG